MSQPFVGDIRMFAGTFAPHNYAFCDGQILAINDQQTLFSLVGTMYGGDGRSSFGLPEMRGRVPVHKGQGPGTSNWVQGQLTGVEDVTLDVSQLPAHNHSFMVSNSAPTTTDPTSRSIAKSGHYLASANVSFSGSLDDLVLSPSGGGQAHDNMAPFMCINFIIALNGVYPSRN